MTEEREFTVPEAAAYMGMSASNVRMHLYTYKDLKPDRTIGRNLMFRQSTLDRFMAEWGPRRRFPKEQRQEETQHERGPG